MAIKIDCNEISPNYLFCVVALLPHLHGDLVGELVEPLGDLAHHVGADLTALVDKLGAPLVHHVGHIAHQALGLSASPADDNTILYYTVIRYNTVIIHSLHGDNAFCSKYNV